MHVLESSASASLLCTTRTTQILQPLLTTCEGISHCSNPAGGNGSWAQPRVLVAAEQGQEGSRSFPPLLSDPLGKNPQRGEEKTGPRDKLKLFREAKPTGTLSVFNIIHGMAFKNSVEFTAVAVVAV